MVSESLIDPPGWITPVIPAFPNKSIPSLKGKNPSDAATAFLLRDPLLSRAILTAPLRFLKVPTP